MARTKIRLVFLLICLLPARSNAQSKGSDLARNPSLKFSFLPLYSIDNAFVLAAEFPLSNGRFSLQPELGYGTSITNLLQTPLGYYEPPDKRNFQTKLQFRYYYKTGSRFLSYTGGEYSYKHSDYQQNSLDGRSGTFLNSPLDLRRANHAVHGLLGWRALFNSRATVDFYIGLGVRMTHNQVRDARLSADEYARVRIYDEARFLRDEKPGRFGPYPSAVGAIQLGILLGNIRR